MYPRDQKYDIDNRGILPNDLTFNLAENIERIFHRNTLQTM